MSNTQNSSEPAVVRLLNEDGFEYSEYFYAVGMAAAEAAKVIDGILVDFHNDFESKTEEYGGPFEYLLQKIEAHGIYQLNIINAGERL